MNSEVVATIREALKFHKRKTIEFRAFDPAMTDEQVARLDAALVALEEAAGWEPILGVSMKQAQDLLVKKFALRQPPKLRYATFSHVYPDSGGPLGGIGGQSITTFWLDAWFDPNDGYAVIFYGDKVLEIMGLAEFDVCSTYRQRKRQPAQEGDA